MILPLLFLIMFIFFIMDHPFLFDAASITQMRGKIKLVP